MKICTLFLAILISFSFFSCDFDSPSSSKNQKKLKNKIYNGVRKNYLKGHLASTVTYKDSLKNGPATNYYPDGKINMEFNYKNNQKNGAYKWYFENGKVYLEGNYKNGEKHGLFTMYRENGKIKSKMPWNEGLPCVGLKEYFDSGNLKPIPQIIVRKKNTIKLNNEFRMDFKLSENHGKTYFYEGYLKENDSFDDIFPQLSGKENKAYLTTYVPKGSYIMKTITIIATTKTRDKNYYVVKKNINISVEHR